MRKHAKRKNKKIIILAVLRLIFFILLIVSIINIVKWYIDSKENKLMEEKASDAIIVDNETEYRIDFENLKETNNQVVAWLKVKGTEVEYPIVQAKDNNYYMNRNLEKKYNVGGWIFADYRNKLDGTDKNIVIYGHNMKDNSMFGSLKNVLKEEWYNNKENYIIDFITEEYHYKYKVFSVYKIEREDYYIKTNFKKNEFEKFINTLKNRSIKDFCVSVSQEDKILTLSTCADDNKYRVVVHAKKMSK